MTEKTDHIVDSLPDRTPDLITITMTEKVIQPTTDGGREKLLPGVAYSVPERFADLAERMGWATRGSDTPPADNLPTLLVPAGVIDGATGKKVFEGE